jgi:hypothetical protein
MDFLKGHTIDGFWRGPRRHGPSVPRDLPVRVEIERGVEQVFIDTLQRESSEPSIPMDVQDGVGGPHPTVLHILSSD